MLVPHSSRFCKSGVIFTLRPASAWPNANSGEEGRSEIGGGGGGVGWWG